MGSAFALACIFQGAAASFVVTGDYVKREATVSRSGGGAARAFVSWDFTTPPKPKLAILVRGKGRSGDWRDLYVVDTAARAFTHINEQWVDGPDHDPFMAVQGGTCTSAAG
jgi:hypothetical protein